ncbi:unnamed protein product [Rotaria sp. Silwood1]|nr:unnamed protein product [Rotaria sp. Silwood1]CAF4545615.1 unnamed protein product [Rotaria sp. Silwood1]CAF4961960.1 unnamed protein product [Rotaria sp. Silwood1]
MLRPELIVPPIVEKLFASIDNTNEPHRFTSIMTCLTRITRQLVRQTSCYSQGQTYVLPLITSVLPGIDLNDFKKTLVTLEFLDTIFMLITCVDCSSAIHIRNDLTEMIREKITDFLTHACWPSKVRKLVTGLVRAIVMGDSVETLKYLLPKTCESINKIINDSEGNVLLNDHKGDKELTWYLVLFSELVRARGDTLMIYKETIISVFHRCIQIIHKGSYKAIASAAKHILKSLTHVYIIDTRLAIENIDESFIDFLPIRAWGQPTNADQVQVQYHIPNDDELDFVREFVETFMYVELDLLKEKSSKLSNDERLRSLTIVHQIAIGCFRIVPRIGSSYVPNLVPTVVPYSAQSQAQYSIFSKQPKFRENLRLRLLIDIGKLLGESFIDESF